jgi:hypothetical protein
MKKGCLTLRQYGRIWGAIKREVWKELTLGSELNTVVTT